MTGQCVYEIVFPSGKRYIGITADFRRRMIAHKTKANTGSRNHALHHAIRKYGFDPAWARVVLYGSVEYTKLMEQALILAYNTRSPNGYNLTAGGDGIVDFKHGDAAKEKISGASKLLWERSSHREAISAALKGRKYSENHRRSISDGIKRARSEGGKYSTFTKAMSGRATINNGTIQRMVFLEGGLLPEGWIRGPLEYNKARKIGDKDPEHSARMRAKWEDPEYRAAMVAAHTGLKHSEESKPVRSAALKAAWEKEDRRTISRKVMTGRKFINNGIETKLVFLENGTPPDGWKLGAAYVNKGGPKRKPKEPDEDASIT
jgi:group I intron endonuclease